jgi:hypothetical protein
VGDENHIHSGRFLGRGSTAKPTASSNANSSDGIKVAGFVGWSKTMITVMSVVIWAHFT